MVWLLDEIEGAFFACALPILYVPTAFHLARWIAYRVALTSLAG